MKSEKVRSDLDHQNHAQHLNSSCDVLLRASNAMTRVRVEKLVWSSSQGPDMRNSVGTISPGFEEVIEMLPINDYFISRTTITSFIWTKALQTSKSTFKAADANSRLFSRGERVKQREIAMIAR